MSDVGLNLPPWVALLVLSVEFWPIVLALALAALAAAIFLRGLGRYVGSGIAVLLVLDLAVVGAIGLMRIRDERQARAYDQSVTTNLAAEQVIDGLKLPAGTVVSWADPTHAHLTAAQLPRPAPLLGVTADRVQRIVEGGWALHLAGQQPVDGWTCQPDLVELTEDGRLHRCELAAGRDWNGWPVPPATLVSPAGDAIGFVFPPAPPIEAPLIGRALPATGGMRMNSDGSLDSVYFDQQAPLAICGRSLWNTVHWRYDPATLGQGRQRPPIGVTGATPSGDTVELELPGCKN